MENYDSVLDDIFAYTDFLIDAGYKISFTILSPVILLGCPPAHRYDAHLCSVCSYLKRNPATLNACHANKLALIRRAPTEPYYGCCYAGVEEYVVPLLHNGIPIALVHVSGYRRNVPRSARLMARVAAKSDKRFTYLYKKLSASPPPPEKVNAFAAPLEYMFGKLYELCENKSSGQDEHVLGRILDYVYEHYVNDISYADIARELCYSESYLRHIFKAQTNKTIKQFVMELRLSHAANLLLSSDYSITEIAILAGFNDSNHFSAVFHKHFGVAPKQYRRSRGEAN